MELSQKVEPAPFKPHCTKAEGNRQIQVSFRLREMRAQAKQRLLSEQGCQLHKQRSIDVETVFGRIKQDWSFRRFLLRGLEKVRTEYCNLLKHPMQHKTEREDFLWKQPVR